MSWTKFASNEKEKIYEILSKNHSDEYTARFFWGDYEKNSYFNEYDSESDIIGKVFKTLPDFRGFLSDMWKKDVHCLDEMTIFCAIAAFKGKDSISVEEQKEFQPNADAQNGYELPDYVYMF